MMVVVESQDFNASTNSSSSGWTRIILPRTTHGNYFNIFYFSRNTWSSCLVCLFIHDHAHTYAAGTTHLRRSHGTHFLPVCMGGYKNDDDDGSHSII